MSDTKTAVAETDTHENSREVSRHEIYFYFNIVSCSGQPVSDTAEPDDLYDKLRLADADLFDKLPRAVQDWRFVDNHEVQIDRLEMFQPEFARLEEAPSERCYEISVYADHEIAASEADATERRPLSVQRLLQQVPAAIQSIYSSHGIVFNFKRAGFRKNLVQSVLGNYEMR